MSLDINGYNDAFRAFTDFATQSVNVGDAKAIARVETGVDITTGALAGRTITAAQGDSLRHMFKWTRSEDNQAANNIARDLFKNAIIDMFDGEKNIPKSVMKAMLMSDYGKGKPLTARRIMAVKAAVDAHFSAPPDKLDVQVRGRTVTFEKWHYEGLVAEMPESQRPRGIEGRAQLADMIRNTLAGRIENGLRILQEVRAGMGFRHAASAANVADLTLALHAIGLSNGDKLKEGSFSVSDPDGNLARWLDTSDEVYLRESSHLKAYQKMTVDGHRNILRGIDVRGGQNGLLAGMRTVHYGTIPDLKTPDGNGPNRRLFLKCESHGCFHNPLSKEDEAAGMTPNMHQREARDGDWSEAILHTFSFLGTRGADPTAGGARKEHMTAGMKAALKGAVDKLKAAGRADLAEQLTARNVEKGGSALLFENLFKAIDGEPENVVLQEVVNDLIAAAKADIGDKHGDAIARLGNEVMVDEANLEAFAPNPVPFQVKGAAAQQITDVLMDNSDLRNDPDATSKLRSRMNAIAKSEITVHIADQIGVKLLGKGKDGTPFVNLGKMDTSFDKDIMRDVGWTIDGRPVPKDPKVARDMLARFVSGNENATYDEADNELKTKVHILMGCMHQGVSACAMEGTGFAFNDKPDPLARLNGNEHPDGGKKTQSFALTRDDSGNIVIDHKVHFAGGVLMQITNGGDRLLQKKTDKNGGMDYGIKITIPQADLDRLGSADWTHYDPTQVNQALGDTNLPNRFSTAENLVPDQFRFTGSVDVTCEIRATSLHDLGEEL
ncbi:MAG: hypothetical protein II823_08235 [Kiritimatiellae bacterium]|nr:hypothetical protein [Kiritimatiellia bacterium]